MSQHRNEEKPWDDWQIDRPFLESLDTWTQHSENRLDRFLDTVIDVIDSGKDAFDLIPDTPFPVGTLCKGLRMLVLLANVSSPFPTTIICETLNSVEHDMQDVRLARSRVSWSCGSRYIETFTGASQDPHVHSEHHSMGR